jgi:xanthine dehydrogenase accessory factor
MNVFAQLIEAIAAEGAGALVSVTETDGSAPREEGAYMIVRPSGAFRGTIGGGALEWDALAAARSALDTGRGPARRMRQHLGPDLGQCCGGRVSLCIETFDARDRDALASLAEAAKAGPLWLAVRPGPDGRLIREAAPADLHRHPAPAGLRLERHGIAATTLLLFGAGHVARALVLALAPLPFDVRWIDERPEAFPALLPANAQPVRTDGYQEELRSAPDGAFILVMTHSHAIDFDVVAAALAPARFAYVGLIGSATKRVRFERRLRDLGLDGGSIARLVCPIGIGGIDGKEPPVIAASTAAQLLERRESIAREANQRN